MRYFRSQPSVYQQVCAAIDSAYGYPNADTKTDRALPLVTDLPHDGTGRVYLAIQSEYCDYVLPSQMLSELLSSRAVEEISEAEYQASFVPTPMP